LLETAADVFYLTADELLAENGGGAALSIPERVKERKAEMEYFSRVNPPPVLGTMPAFEMTEGGPLIRAMLKSDMAVPTGISDDSQALQGQAGSPGVVRGTAKVIPTLAEAGKLQPGDILVTKMTMPPWTPLFATAAAVVTDYGGVLSHCAVVAREYGIPAVVGTGRATKTFHDGQILEVNGDVGTVRVVTSF